MCGCAERLVCQNGTKVPEVYTRLTTMQVVSYPHACSLDPASGILGA